MAEAFGALTGAAGLVGAFTSCVECFKIIQLGRNFERDFKDSQITLDLLQSRLARWGEGMGLDPDQALPPPGSHITTFDNADLAEKVMCQIRDLFEASFAKSAKYQQDPWNANQLALCSPADLPPAHRSIHEKLRGLSLRGKKKPSTLTVAKWALYDSEDFESLVAKINTHIDNLEKVFPVPPPKEADLLRREMGQFADKMEMDIITNIAEKFDAKLHTAAQKPGAVEGHAYHHMSTNLDAKVINGDHVVDGLFQGNVTLKSHSYSGITMNGGKTLNGNQVGGKGMWDD